MEIFDVRIVVLGGVVGLIVGTFLHLRSRSTGGIARRVQARRATTRRPLVERAGRAMAIHGRVVDAANAGNLPEVRRLIEQLTEAEKDDGPVTERQATDPALRSAAESYMQLREEMDRSINAALATGKVEAIPIQIRLRGAALSQAIKSLTQASPSER